MLYQKIRDLLETGETVGVVTSCTGAGVTKRLLRSGDNLLCQAMDAGGIAVDRRGDGLTVTESFAPESRLVILGCGHIAVPLAEMAAIAGFPVTVFDDRPSFASRERFPTAREVICDSFSTGLDRLHINGSDYVAVLTRGHRWDADCLRHIFAGQMPAYLGMIGSRRRVAIVKADLEGEGVPLDKLDRLHAPIGLPIGGVTPGEIAVSILAQLIEHKRIVLGEDSGDGRAMSIDGEVLDYLVRNPDTPCAMVTVVEARGSVPRGRGAKMLVLPDGRSIGSIGGGCAEADVLRDALDMVDGGGRLREVDLADSAEEDGMVCGGSMTVLIEGVVY